MTVYMSLSLIIRQNSVLQKQQLYEVTIVQQRGRIHYCLRLGRDVLAGITLWDLEVKETFLLG